MTLATKTGTGVLAAGTALTRSSTRALGLFGFPFCYGNHGNPPYVMRLDFDSPQFLRKGQNPIHQRTHARRADYRRKLALTI